MKGSLEIIDKKSLCKSCVDIIQDDFANTKEISKIAVFMNEKKFDEAITTIQSFFNKEHDAHWYNLGNMYYRKLQYSEALDCFDNTLFLNTHYIKAWYRKGTLLYGLSKLQDLEKLQDSKQCFKNILLLDPENKQMWNNASAFFIALCSILIHNRYVQEGKDAIKTNQEVQKWVSVIMPYKYPVDLANNLNNNLAGKKGKELLDSLIDWWFFNFDDILNALEPKIGVINIYSTEGRDLRISIDDKGNMTEFKEKKL